MLLVVAVPGAGAVVGRELKLESILAGLAAESLDCTAVLPLPPNIVLV